jgi:hypothetical protein
MPITDKQLRKLAKAIVRAHRAHKDLELQERQHQDDWSPPDGLYLKVGAAKQRVAKLLDHLDARII